jgi:hypothetical protein
MSHPVRWNIPTPLWRRAVDENRPGFRGVPTLRFGRPEILRFDSDDFIDVFRTTLEEAPEAVAEFQVREETWRTSAEDWSNAGVAGLNDPVRLFQPVQKRFYLATASLVCRESGLPDRRVDAGEDERVTCVVRRVEPVGGSIDVTDESTFREYGWCGDDGWTQATPGGILDGEEELPMFPVSYPVERALDDHRTDRFQRSAYRGDGAPGPVSPKKRTTVPPRRTLWAAVIPVARRDEYEIAPSDAGVPAVPPGDATFGDDQRWQQIQALTFQPLVRVARQSEPMRSYIVPRIRDAVVYAVLDLLDVLDRAGFQDVLDHIAGGAAASSEANAVLNTLRTADLGTINGTDYHWDWLFSRVLNEASGMHLEDASDVLSNAAAQQVDWPSAVQNLGVIGAGLHDDIRNLLDTSDTGKDERPPDAPAAYETIDDATYIIRCIYHRPNCPPYPARTISDASRLMTFASFFDPDGPVRPLRVSLPANTDVGTFRGAAKGVSFLFSSQLRQQVQRLQEITFEQLDDEDLPSPGGGVSIGMICSLSIPIITIVALILLLVLVFALNIVFWWLPYFKICFPIPVPSDD